MYLLGPALYKVGGMGILSHSATGQCTTEKIFYYQWILPNNFNNQNFDYFYWWHFMIRQQELELAFRHMEDGKTDLEVEIVI